MHIGTQDKKIRNAMNHLATLTGRFFLGLRDQALNLWHWFRPEARKRGQVLLDMTEKHLRDHQSRATILYRWLRRRYSPERPVRSVLAATVLLLRATLHELLGWPSVQPSERRGWAPNRPDWTPTRPELSTDFHDLPSLPGSPPSPGEEPPGPGL